VELFDGDLFQSSSKRKRAERRELGFAVRKGSIMEN
jgi:hypothetical protein